MANLEAIKIPSSVVNSKSIASLPDNPSETGMSAQQLKDAFDALPKEAISALNALIDYLLTSGASDIGITEIEGMKANTVQAALEVLKSLADTKQSIDNTKALVKNVEFNEKTGLFTFTKLDGSTKTIDTQAEKIPVSGALSGQTLELILVDGTKLSVDLSELFSVGEAKNLIKNIEYTENTGVFTVTKYDGSKFTINTALEKVALDVRLDGQQFVLTLVNGTEQRVDLSEFLTQTEVKNSDTVTLAFEDGAIVARLVSKSVTMAHLADEVTAKINKALNKNVANVKIINERLTLTFVDGTTTSIDIADYLRESDLSNSNTILFSVKDGKVVAEVADNAIKLANLSSEVKEYINQNGGSSNPSDWNVNDENATGYVKNRTHWKEAVVEYAEIMSEESVRFNSNLASCNLVGSDYISEGVNYIVTWAGTVYECTPRTYGSDLYLGNTSLVGDTGNDTGEPFVFEVISKTDSYIYKKSTVSESIVISLVRPEAAKYHPLGKEYLPDDIGVGADWSVNEANDPAYVKGRTHYVDAAGKVHKLPEKFIPDTALNENAVKEAKEYTDKVFSNLPQTEPGEGSTVVVKADWSVNDEKSTAYIKNRTHWEENNSVEIYPETAFAVPEGSSGFDLSVSGDVYTIGLEVGKEYVVIWNGTDYRCTAKALTTGNKEAFLGNGFYFDGGGDVDTGEPFVIFDSVEDRGLSAYAYLVQTSSSEKSITLSISTYSETIVHKLDKKFLPDDYGCVASYNDLTDKPMWKTGTPEELILPETKFTFEELDIPFALEGFGSDNLVLGETYLVVWYRDTYECVAKAHGEGVYLGSLSALGTEYANTNEPFCIVTTGESSCLIYSHRQQLYQNELSIYKKNTEKYNKLPENYLPTIVDYTENNVASPAYIKNRPFWKVEKGVIFSNSFSYRTGRDRAILKTVIDLIPGLTYQVNHRGAIYNLIAKTHDTEEGTYIYLGDMSSLIGSEQTGEEFGIGYLLEKPENGLIYRYNNSYSSDFSASVKIELMETYYKKLDSEFLNTSEFITTSGSPITEKCKTIVSSNKTATIDDLNISMVEVGQKLIVMFNGVRYDTEVKYLDLGDGLNFTYAGNLSVSVTGFPNTFEPFCITFNKNSVAISGTEEFTASINVLEKLPLDFLPDGVPYANGGNKKILSETTLTMNEDLGGMPITTAMTLEAGKNYVVTWNGAEYACTSVPMEDDGVSAVLLGNYDLMMGGTGTGEPFLLMYAPGMFGEGVYAMAMAVDGSSTATMSITFSEEKIKRMDERCMPESVESIILRSSTPDSTKLFKITVDDSGTIKATEVTE